MSTRLFCPACEPEPVYDKSNLRHCRELELVEYNYHGCGVDIFYCTGCKKYWQVSYKVDKVIPLGW